MAGIILFFYVNVALFLGENSIIFIHVDAAAKANLHAYKRMIIRPAIYERGLFALHSRGIDSRSHFGAAQS